MPKTIDSAIADLAARQHGYVTRAQLLGLGLSSGQIVRRLGQGLLIRVHNAVYAVGHLPVAPVSQAGAAVLACGSGAALSHGSAATLWTMRRHWERPYEVTCAKDRRQRGIRVHACCNLTRRDVTTHFGIRVISPARTLLQIAPRLTRAQLARAYNDGLLAHYLREGDVQELLHRRASDPGAAALRAVAPPARNGGGPTRSELEDAFRAFVKRYGLPEPEMNVMISGLMVDAWFPEQRLIVELDSWGYHGGRQAFEEDRERDAITLADGLPTLRVTHERIEARPDAEAARLSRILKLT